MPPASNVSETVSHKYWRYDLPSIKHEGWGIVILTNDGIMSVVSDWGNYAYLWTHPGVDDFRKFIVQCNGDYIRRKLDSSEIFDSHETEKKLKEWVLRSRRSRQIDEHYAYNAYHMSVSNDLDLMDWIRAHEEVVPDYWHEEVPIYCPPGLIRGFVKHLLPRLQEAIRQDLARV